MSDYGEPWKIDGDGIETREGYILSEGEYCYRIVACVNACAGIPTEQLSGDTGRFAPLQWRKEPPDEPGHYWLRLVGDEPGDKPELATVHERFGVLYYEIDYSGGPVSRLGPGCIWAGPIQPPPSPQ